MRLPCRCKGVPFAVPLAPIPLLTVSSVPPPPRPNQVAHGSEPAFTWPSGIIAPLMDEGHSYCADYIYVWQAAGYTLQVCVCGGVALGCVRSCLLLCCLCINWTPAAHPEFELSTPTSETAQTHIALIAACVSPSLSCVPPPGPRCAAVW
jgi:hypothetical protein